MTKRMWYHDSVARELRRLRDECGKAAYNVKGIAGNIGHSELDVARWLNDMAGWGEVEHVAPLSDFRPDTWYALTRRHHDLGIAYSVEGVEG